MKKLIFAFMVLICSSSLFAQSATELLDNSNTAMNSAGLEKVQTMKISGSQFNSMLGQELTTSYIIKFPDKIRIEIEYMGQIITSAYNGKKGWSVNPLSGSTSKETLPDEAIPQLMQVLDLLESPIADYKKEGNSYELDGTETIDEKLYNKVKIVDKDSNAQVIYLDAITNWFYKITTVVPGEEGDMNFEVVYVEKTRKKGIILPKLIEVIVNGEKNSIMKFDEYELDAPIEDSVFEKL